MRETAENASSLLAGRRVAFVGKLGGVTKREAERMVRQQGGTPVELGDGTLDLIVIGADTTPFGYEDLLHDQVRQAVLDNKLQVIHETQLWENLGLVENEQSVHRLYTPAMLADLISVPISIVRRWHRRGLIVPVREVNRLPYFDFKEVATAQRLAQLLAHGVTPSAIEKKLDELSRFVPDVERPLAQLSVIVEGRHLLLRQGEGLVEPGGQMRFDFEAADRNDNQDPCATTLRFQPSSPDVTSTKETIREAPAECLGPDEMLFYATELEDEGHLDSAIEIYRAYLMRMGSSAEACFALAELLYRSGEILASRERYYMAIELDEDYVEARGNLGCVLAETGQLELAVAAFQGALDRHYEYPDVHYHLARTLEELGRQDEAVVYWKEFVKLAPDSPWAEEARIRLGDSE